MNKEVRTQLRTTNELHQWLVSRAKNNDRSMNAEINRILKQKMEEEVQKQAA